MKYLLLQVSKADSSVYRYVNEETLNLQYHIPLGNPSALYMTKRGAISAVRKLSSYGAKYPSLYDIDKHYRWGWDLLSNHPEYTEYLKMVDEYKKEKKRIDRTPIDLRPHAPTLMRPKPPHGNAPQSVPSVSSGLTTSYVNTSDDYNKLVMQISDLSIKIEVLGNRIGNLTDTCDDELEAQKAALVAFGGIIKGMDDRLEDLEHNLTK